MRRFAVLSAALTLSLLAAGIAAGALAAQTETPDPAALPDFAACRPGEATIETTDLPPETREAPGKRIVDLDRCPVGDRFIFDHAVGAVLPEPGHSVYAEALSVGGTQELVVTRRLDGTVELESVGNEESSQTASEPTAVEPRVAAPTECNDPGPVEDVGKRLEGTLDWRYYRASTPTYPEDSPGLDPDAALADIRAGGMNIMNVRNVCGYGDGVTGQLSYAGTSKTGPNISSTGGCGGPGFGTSVVGFGGLNEQADGDFTLAVNCSYAFPDGQIADTDVKLDNLKVRWSTADPASCRNNTPGQWNLEATMTHERGHSFGLGHIAGYGNNQNLAESEHANLTMSPNSNGTCQGSEITLGKGDAVALNKKP